jgi:DNA-binding GntR family transcriptional regulator
MLEILMEIEGLAARLAARRMPAVQRKQLELAHEACQRAAAEDDPVAYGKANRTFHEIIYDGSLNEVLARQLRSMRLRMRHPQSALFDRPNRIRNSLAEHEVIMRAILSGNEEEADRAMVDHISSGGNVYADAIARMPQTRT